MNAEKKAHPVGYGTRTSALFNSAALAGLPWLSPGADPAGHLCNTEDWAFAPCWASVVCGYWDTYEGQDLVGSELVERLVAGGIFANPRMTRCRPALDTASSWERCQRTKLRRPQHALGEPCFDQLLSGLRRSARHSRSVKGGGASNPVSNVSMPSWCHLNHPSTAPPALGRWTCRWQCVFRFGSWDCRASVYRYQPPCSQVHQDPRHQAYWRRGSGAAPCTDIMDESCYACFRRAFATCRGSQSASHVRLSFSSSSSCWVSGRGRDSTDLDVAGAEASAAGRASGRSRSP